MQEADHHLNFMSLEPMKTGNPGFSTTVESYEISTRHIRCRSSYKPGKPEINFVVKRAQLAEYNLSSNQVATVCRAALEGIVPTKFRVGNNEYDIRVTIPEKFKSDLKYLENLPVVNPMQNLFSLIRLQK